MSRRLSEAGADPIDRGGELAHESCAATNVAIADLESRPYVSLADAESDLRKEFETLSERVYLEGRDDRFDPALVRASARRVAARAMRLACMCGDGR